MENNQTVGNFSYINQFAHRFIISHTTTLINSATVCGIFVLTSSQHTFLTIYLVVSE